ncbi:MAG TPA: phosphate signaling complex protein PhoU [Firmicutes bacterium]|nr:phosphate signaling complex protein PhoU [Candidatus Fermentithermobacillaceae bacterium]
MYNPRASFENQLKELERLLLEMGRAAETMLEHALEALAQRDVDLANDTIASDDKVDYLKLEIESKSMELIATQQPAAKDLRRIFGAIQIASDVERVADYSVNICESAIKLADKPLFKPLIDIPRMEQVVVKMLKESLEGFVDRDLELIEQMILDDEEVDNLYESLYDELCEFMKKDPSLVDQAVELVLISRHLERIADHITNIGERVYYVETGIFTELHQ